MHLEQQTHSQGWSRRRTRHERSSRMALVAEGRTNREIAATLFLGKRTVASHLNNI